ncbi:MAG: DUF1638 domain-containing protein [Bacillota bacterium]
MMDRLIIACEVLRYELEYLGVNSAKCLFLPQGLHQSPSELGLELQKAIKKAENDWNPRMVVLAYGRCGGGVIGLQAAKAVLRLPLADDCISLLLGEGKKTNAETYYLSAGWVDFASDPYRQYLKLRDIYGEEDANWCSREMMKGYKRICLIRNEAREAENYWKYAGEMAGFFFLQTLQVDGNLNWLRRLVKGSGWKNLIKVPPGMPVREEHFQIADEHRRRF